MSRDGLPILTYHAFDTSKSPIATDPGWFAESMAALFEAGYRTIDLEDWFAQGRPVVGRRFALTFDDGLASILAITDVLDRYELHASVFAVTGHVGRDNAWAGQPRAIPSSRLLSWPELRGLSARGLTIGSHTHSHALLNRLDKADLDAELRRSKDLIEASVGRPCRLFAYPYGVASDRVRTAAAQTYLAAFATGPAYARSREDRHRISRIDAFDVNCTRRVAKFLAGQMSGYLSVRRAVRGVRRAALAWSHSPGQRNLNNHLQQG